MIAFLVFIVQRDSQTVLWVTLTTWSGRMLKRLVVTLSHGSLSLIKIKLLMFAVAINTFVCVCVYILWNYHIGFCLLQQLDFLINLPGVVCLSLLQPNSLILAISPANQDIATSDAMKLARDVDPGGALISFPFSSEVSFYGLIIWVVND